MARGIKSRYLLDHFGWSGGFYLWIGSDCLSILLFLPLWSAKARKI